MKTPLLFRLDIFIIIQDIINKEFVIFSEIPFPDSVDLIIDEYSTITKEKYEIIKIDETNMEDFIGTKEGDYVLSWKNSDEEFKNDINKREGKRLVLQYVNYEQEIEEEEDDTSDDTNWEGLQ